MHSAPSFPSRPLLAALRGKPGALGVDLAQGGIGEFDDLPHNPVGWVEHVVGAAQPQPARGGQDLGAGLGGVWC